MDWNDPEARLALVERVGLRRYNVELEAHQKASVVSTVNGHEIRPVGGRWGRLYMVSGTDRAFRSLAEAESFAEVTA